MLVAFELEVFAKKLDKFGWDRDRGTPAHDRIVLDWMDALQDYSIEEVRAACKAHILKNEEVMPHEGHIVAHIMESRRVQAQKHAAQARNAQSDHADGNEPQSQPRVSTEAARAIMEEYGFTGSVNIGEKFNG